MYAFTVILYGILKVGNTLIKSAYCEAEYDNLCDIT